MNPRAKAGEPYVPTTIEHIANICTHGVSSSLYVLGAAVVKLKVIACTYDSSATI